MLPLWGKYDSQSWYIVVYLQYASILVRIYYPYLKVVSPTQRMFGPDPADVWYRAVGLDLQSSPTE